MRRFWLLVLTLLTPVASSAGNFIAWKPVEATQNLVKCLQTMFLSDTNKPASHIRVSIESDSKSDGWKFGDLLDQLLATFPGDDALFEIRHRNSQRNKGFIIDRRILFVDSFESFERQVQLQRSHAVDFSGFYQFFYVVLPTNVRNLDGVLRQITQFCLENTISNVNILVEDSNQIITIYTYYPFTEAVCRNSEPHVYNYFQNGTFTWNKPVFPHKTKNLWQCPLNVIMWEEAPFFQNINHPGREFGIDMTVLKYLASSMNFTWNFVQSPLGPGKVLSNGTCTDGFKMLEDRMGDLMLSGTTSTAERLSNFAATGAYFLLKIQLVMKPPEKYSPLVILLSPFDRFTWLTMLTIFLGNWIISGLLRRLQTNYNINQRVTTNLLRLVMLLSVMTFRSFYEGLIYRNILHNPRKNLPQTLSEAVAEKHTIVFNQLMYNLYGTNFPEIEGKQLKVINVSTNGILREFYKLKGKYALITVGSSLTVFKTEISPFKEAYRNWVIIEKPLCQNYISMFLPKFSFLTRFLSVRVSQMLENGYRYKVYKQFIKNVLEKDRFADVSNNLPVKLGMENFSGIFKLLLGMILVQVGVFLLEILSIRSRRLRIILDIFHRN